jgi:hypothetical protein
MQFGLAPHSGTIFWMRELRSSGQTKVQRMLNVPERWWYIILPKIRATG